jgi:hypothetical protein
MIKFLEQIADRFPIELIGLALMFGLLHFTAFMAGAL